MDWIKKYFEDLTGLNSVLDGVDDYNVYDQEKLVSLLSAAIKDAISVADNYQWTDVLKEDLANLLKILSAKKIINSTSLYLFDISTNTFHLEISSLEDDSLAKELDLKHELVAPVLKTKEFFCFREKRSLFSHAFKNKKPESIGVYPLIVRKKFVGILLIKSFEHNIFYINESNLFYRIVKISEQYINSYVEKYVNESRSRLFLAFFELHKLLGRVLEKEAIFEIVGKILDNVFEPARITFFLFDLKNNTVKIEKIMKQADLVSKNQIIEGFSIIQKTIISNKEPFFIENLKEDKAYGSRFNLEESDKFDLGSLLICPIIAVNKTIGGLQLEFNQTDAIKENYIVLFKKLSFTLGNALEKNHLYKKMEKMATTDFLTGLLLKREFMKFLRMEIKRSKRTKLPLALLMIDVDKFKKVNDNYGHLAGDKVLKLIAQIINSSKREIDIAGRYAGDEFCIILLNTTKEQAMLTAERIRKKTSATPILINKDKISVTLSIGVAIFEQNSNERATDLISKSDQAMYYGRRDGDRNLVTFYDKSCMK